MYVVQLGNLLQRILQDACQIHKQALMYTVIYAVHMWHTYVCKHLLNVQVP